MTGTVHMTAPGKIGEKDTLGKQEEIWPSAEEKVGLFGLRIPKSSSHLSLFDLFVNLKIF